MSFAESWQVKVHWNGAVDFSYRSWKASRAACSFEERVEIVGRENLALNDGEVDLYLVEPTGVDEVCTGRIEGQRACRRRTHFFPR
jgi:hypothetical protein